MELSSVLNSSANLEKTRCMNAVFMNVRFIVIFVISF